MRIPKNLKDLTSLFEKLGAPNPESWAKSQIERGISQLHRFLFLRQAWSSIIQEDSSWIHVQIKHSEKDQNAPFAGIGLALKHALKKGISENDLTDIARGMQAELLFALCYLLEDPSFEEPELGDIGWCLVETDASLDPSADVISGLHESVLETDPTGREMRPRRTL